MKIIKKVLYTTLIMMLMIIPSFSVSYGARTQSTAVEDGAYSEKDPIKNPDYFDPSLNDIKSGSKTFIDKANVVLAIIRILGTVVAVITLMVIGIKFMFGSTEDKASYKETMVPYIVGAVMLFAIPNFLAVIFDLVSSIKF